MTEKREPDINWELTTWKGSRLQQHREFYALPFARKLEIVEQMCEMAGNFDKDISKTAPSSLNESPTSPAPPNNQAGELRDSKSGQSPYGTTRS